MLRKSDLLKQVSLNFKTFCCNLKIRGLRAKLGVSNSKSPCILLNKNKAKMKNTTQIFRESNLVLQLICESQIKSEILMSLSSRKKKDRFIYFIHECIFENLPICLCSYKNNTLKISHS